MTDEDFKFLMVDRKALLKDAPKYDGKKNVWIADKKQGFIKAEIKSTKGEEVTVILTEEKTEKSVKKDHLHSMNPPKFEMIEDMASLTYLNEASVLYNLKSRYCNQFIYTYSGLFCVTINPYKRLPIYSPNVIQKYRGKRRNEMPPHLFSVADNAYNDMLRNRENQSMLITGESGAGKTENTKKVISYFASVAAGSSGKESSEQQRGGTLEDAIIQANPVLEAYGNAKTVRNNNSSRFGKFIRIHFGTQGKIAGADIETYLLEKSRVTYQLPGVERNYHIFYFILSGQIPEHAEKLLVKFDPGMYHFINQGCLTVDGMDDKEEMQLADDAFAVLGINEQDKIALYQCTSAVMQFGEMKFKQRPRDEQAEADGSAEAEKVAHLVGVNCQDLLKSLLSPKVKVGSEWVTKGQNLGQVNFAVAALAKALYSRMFQWLVNRVNQTLDTKKPRQYFIGVLDIAGFEIFEMNTLEQLLINYTNERLQQFFNHHMFVLEQEEYKKEGIQWEFIDFGMDLQDTIDLIEKPMGVLSILEEQCMFPKATNETLKSMLYENHLGKSKTFGKPKPNKSAKFEAHFELYHYAGTVAYNINGWLFKNKDPLNQCVSDLMGKSKDRLVSALFPPPEEDKGGGKKRKGKGSAFQTISATHREQLHKLIYNLNTTAPHFVRCIIPNERKCPFELDPHLVLHQLQCNGVLEGIRICRKGFPSRMIYSEFKQRYSILASSAISTTGFVDGKEATEKIIEALQLDNDQYKLGHTKVFFRAGVLGNLEDLREERLSKVFTLLQAHCRGFLLRKSYNTLVDQRMALSIIQRNIRKWITLRHWLWWKLYLKIKPLLSIARQEDELKEKEKELEETKTSLDRISKVKQELEEQNVMLLKAKNDLFLQLQSESDRLGEAEEKIEQLVKTKFEYESTIQELEERLNDEEGASEKLESINKELNEECDNLKHDIDELQLNLQRAEQDKTATDNKLRTVTAELEQKEEQFKKLAKDKKNIDDILKRTQEALAAEEDKTNHLNKQIAKLKSHISDLEESLEKEKKNKANLDKVRKKLESDLKMTQETVEDLQRVKRDLEDNVRRKDAEINNLNSQLEEEQSLVAQLQKKIKDLQDRIEELEEELENERQAKQKVEKARAQLASELEELTERLDEAGGATAAQIEANKKREMELQKLRHDLEEQQVHTEQQIASLKKKNQDTVNELSDQLDQLSKAKTKVEKEKSSMKSELNDMHSQHDHLQKSKAAAEKLVKQLEAQLSETMAKIDEHQQNIVDMENSRSKLNVENTDLQQQLEEAESQVNSLSRVKQNMGKQLEEAKSNLEEESRLRQKLQSEARHLHDDITQLQEQMEDEQEAKVDLQRALTKITSEANEWRRKCEAGEGGVNSEELDDLKRKLNARLAEVEAQLESAQSKCQSLEKAKQRLQGELEDAMMEVERAQVIANQADKRQRQFDKTIEEWKGKYSELEMELQNSQAESRSNAAEVYRLRSQIDETNETINNLQRDNKRLSDEINDLTDQLGEGGRSVHDLDKARRRLAEEKEDLQNALEEAELALETEEAKVTRLQLEISSIKQDIEKRIGEKEEEFENHRKNHQRVIESMQASLEAETRGKTEAIRIKKKLEQDINDLEVNLDVANKNRAVAEKNNKKLQNQIRDLQQSIEDEQKGKSDAKDRSQHAERRVNMLMGELEEVRALLDAAERARKTTEGDLSDANSRISELTTQNTTLTSAKRSMENDLQAMQVDLEDQANETKTAEDKAKKAMMDVSHLVEELRREKEHANQVDKMRRGQDVHLKELQFRLDEAEVDAVKGGKRVVQKLEQKIAELEGDLDGEQRRHQETQKTIRKLERKIKDLVISSEDDAKSKERMQESIDKLQNAAKVYKLQIEELEEIAALNLSKYRKVQLELENAEERADSAENALAKLRAKNRSSVSSTRSSFSSGNPGHNPNRSRNSVSEARSDE